MLLHWSTLQPQGPQSLAAIRFAVPVRVSSIRIFPSGAAPFANAPEVVAETEPEAFYLEVFLNAHPIPQADSKEKPRVPNALVPTLIPYAGKQAEYLVDMGAEYATRLMVLKGSFVKLSIAVYGEVISNAPISTEKREPQPLPLLEEMPLSKALDPSISEDPTLLAKQLLALIPDAPPLPLVVRLIFCLKPSNEDWDLPDFPYLHADLMSMVDGELDLEGVNDLLFRPVRDDATEEELSTFAIQVSECISTPKDSNDAYPIARMLSISASQHPGLARALLRHLELESLFTAETVDEETLLCLADAASNVDVARSLNTEAFLDTLRQIQESHVADNLTQSAARRLSSRITDWQCFEDSLSDPQGNFQQSWSMLQDIGTEELSMAIWLESMIHHEELVTKLAGIPVHTSLQSHYLLHSRNKMNMTSYDGFIAQVRAFIGVASVLAVWAWTDSVGNDICREHTSAVMHLWQGIDGYREIVNHLLLLRQLTRRLNWISSDKEIPRQSGILAEKIICELAKDPQAVLNDDLVDTILDLKPKLTFISDTELLSMRKIALVSEDGLPAAIEELMFTSDHPLSLRRLRTLRVSLAIVKRELDLPKGEWKTLESFWDEGTSGIVPCLLDILIGVSDDLNKHFSLFPPPSMDQILANQLFLAAINLLQLIIQLVPIYPPTTRLMRTLVLSTADIFACTAAANNLFSPSSRAAISSQDARQACLDLLHTLSAPGLAAEPDRVGAEVVFKALLQHGSQCGDRDPALHVLQVSTMIDNLLPEPNAMLYDEGEPSHWVTAALPNVLDELKHFLRLLEPKNRAHIVQRLIKLDDGVLNVGAWLLTEELKDMTRTIEKLAEFTRRESYKLVLQYQVTLSLRFIIELAKPSSDSSEWCLDAIANTSDLSLALCSSLMALLEGRYVSGYIHEFITLLAPTTGSFEPELQFTILLATLRASHEIPNSPPLVRAASIILKGLTSNVITPEPLRMEIGPALSVLAKQDMDHETARSVFSLLQWLSSQADSKYTVLCGISAALLDSLFSSLDSLLGHEDHDTLITLLSAFTIDENDYLPPPTNTLPETLELSIHDIDDLMRQDIPTPVTPPNGAKTPDILGLIISPPTAILRSQVETTGLTKTYMNNDFRQLRQTPSARQNTSRLPSMHGFPKSNACCTCAADARTRFGHVPQCAADDEYGSVGGIRKDEDVFSFISVLAVLLSRRTLCDSKQDG
ncbi:hypothetical protein H0H92_014574 [Tricholoma furcatifolium]|nr:hypothetical protein H0H92_014574 [Tricholoma furcatifolium]